MFVWVVETSTDTNSITGEPRRTRTKKCIDHVLKIISDTIYFLASENGYVGSIAATYYSRMKKVFVSPSTDDHELSGMISRESINMILDSEIDDMQKWYSKWQKFVFNFNHVIKNKLTLTDRGRGKFIISYNLSIILL